MKIEEIEQIKKEHVGKWIALKDSEIIAVDADYHELHKILKEKRFRDIMVIYAPNPEEKKVEFLL